MLAGVERVIKEGKQRFFSQISNISGSRNSQVCRLLRFGPVADVA